MRYRDDRNLILRRLGFKLGKRPYSEAIRTKERAKPSEQPPRLSPLVALKYRFFEKNQVSSRGSILTLFSHETAEESYFHLNSTENGGFSRKYVLSKRERVLNSKEDSVADLKKRRDFVNFERGGFVNFKRFFRFWHYFPRNRRVSQTRGSFVNFWDIFCGGFERRFTRWELDRAGQWRRKWDVVARED